jgi:hypothetical protein
MKKNGSKQIARTAVGIIFTILIIPLTWMLLVGISMVVKSLSDIWTHNLAGILILALIFFLIIIITAFSKLNIGGNILMIFKGFKKIKHK